MFQTLFTDSPDFSYFLFTTIPGQVIQVIPFVLLVGLIDSLIRFLRIKRGNITSYRIGNEVVKTLLVRTVCPGMGPASVLELFVAHGHSGVV